MLDNAGNFTEAELSVGGTTIANSATMLASATNAFSLTTLSMSAATVSNSNTIEALGNNAVDFTESFVNGVLISESGPGGADVIINANTIVNSNSGTILASATGLNSIALISVSATTVTNSGTMEALTVANATPVLTISAATINNANTIEALAGGAARGDAATEVSGTSINNSGTIAAVTSGVVFVSVANGVVTRTVIGGAADTAVTGSAIVNTGALDATARIGIADLSISGGTFTNSGSVAALASGANFALGNNANAFVAITGAAVTNLGTVEASATATGYAVVSISGGTASNSGTMEAIGAAGSLAEIRLSGVVSNGSGHIVVSSAGFVDLDGATVSGGALQTVHATQLFGTSFNASSGGNAVKVFEGSGIGVFAGGSGTISTAAIASSSYLAAWHASSLLTLDDVTFGSGAEVAALMGGKAVLSGSEIFGAGTILEAGMSGTVTIRTTLTDSATSLILASGASAHVDLDNATILGGVLKTSGATTAVIETVSGSTDVLSGVSVAAGSLIEAVNGTLVLRGSAANSGTVAALSGGVVTVSGPVANSGTLVGSGGTVRLSSTATDTPLGLILASGTGAHVELDAATVLGGRLQTIGTGAVIETASGSSVLSGTTILAGSLVEVTDGTTLVLSGTITNAGTLLASGTANPTGLSLATASITGGRLQTSGSKAAIATVSGTVDAITGATIAAGSLVEVASSSTLTLNNDTISAGAIVETLGSGTLKVSGTLTNGGTLFASGAGGLVDILGVVNGGVLEVGDGMVAIAKPGSEAVVFTTGGTGGLELDDHAGDPLDFKGRISGFGGSGHANTTQFIDLVTVTSGASMGLNYVSANAGNTSGTLIVTSGATIVAEITLVGTYLTSNFHLGTGISGSVKITDPAMPSGGGVIANVALLSTTSPGASRRTAPARPSRPARYSRWTSCCRWRRRIAPDHGEAFWGQASGIAGWPRDATLFLRAGRR